MTIILAPPLALEVIDLYDLIDTASSLLDATFEETGPALGLLAYLLEL